MFLHSSEMKSFWESTQIFSKLKDINSFKSQLIEKIPQKICYTFILGVWIIN